MMGEDGEFARDFIFNIFSENVRRLYISVTGVRQCYRYVLT